VLEALLKRVDGLEKKLRDEKKAHSPPMDGSEVLISDVSGDSKPKRLHLETNDIPNETAVYSPTPIRYLISCINTSVNVNNCLQ